MSATLTDLVRLCSMKAHVSEYELAQWFGKYAICDECRGTGDCECECDHGHSISHSCEECDGDGYVLDGKYAEFTLKGVQLGLFNPEYRGKVYMVFCVPNLEGAVVTEEFLRGAKKLAEKLAN
jgi:hypothetical protein